MTYSVMPVLKIYKIQKQIACYFFKVRKLMFLFIKYNTRFQDFEILLHHQVWRFNFLKSNNLCNRMKLLLMKTCDSINLFFLLIQFTEIELKVIPKENRVKSSWDHRTKRVSDWNSGNCRIRYSFAISSADVDLRSILMY